VYALPRSLSNYRVQLNGRDERRSDPHGSLIARPSGMAARSESAPDGDRMPAPFLRLLVMRMYWPKETTPSVLDGTWQVPPVVKVNRQGWQGGVHDCRRRRRRTPYQTGVRPK
jgi:hypothetical protein